MRQVPGRALWIGNAGDLRDPARVLDAGVVAVVDLAGDEPPARPPRDLAYLRFPLVDGPGNPPWLLRAAVEASAGLVRDGVPTLVACGAGLSRSPAVAALALAEAGGLEPAEGLAEVLRSGPADVAPGLWAEALAAAASARRR